MEVANLHQKNTPLSVAPNQAEGAVLDSASAKEDPTSNDLKKKTTRRTRNSTKKQKKRTEINNINDNNNNNNRKFSGHWADEKK